MLVDLALVIERMIFNIFGEPFLELFMRIEKLRHDKMQKSPKFCHAILDWSSS
jgi:hypothetical protein